MITSYTATATREGRWWIITVDGVGVTQARSLRDAPAAAAGLVAAMLDLDEGSVDVAVTAGLSAELRDAVNDARQKVAELADQQREAARASRHAAAALTGAGLTGADVAVVLGVSPQRISQLIAGSSMGMADAADKNSRGDFSITA